MVPPPGFQRKRINCHRAIIPLPIRVGDQWVLRKRPEHVVVIRGFFEDTRVLVIWPKTGRKGSMGREYLLKNWRKKDCPDPRLDKIMERLKDHIPDPLTWGDDVS